MKIQIPFLILSLSLVRFSVCGQSAWFATDSLPGVKKGGVFLLNPWAGGLNAAQYSKMDLDGDGTEDLVVFDRTTSKVSTFIADPGSKRFVYRQEFEALFPSITNWMLLVDYDGDGKKELFCYVSYGVTVYRQEPDEKGGWRWKNLREYLTVTGFSGNTVNLYVVASDIPALVDIDDDGDMDIITFESGGDYLELNQNMSMERYGVPDSLEFVRNGQCWGNFRKHTCDDFVFGVECGVQSDTENARVKHAGNALLLHDLNGDGIRDALVGNVHCENLSIVYNSQSGLASNFYAFAPEYPSTEPAIMPVFPAAYLEDVDFDGVKDLLVSPNVYGNDSQDMDFVASGWYYHNAGTDDNPDFILRQKDFLQEDMVDVGENAAVAFFDVDGDGDADLLIGNRGIYNGTDFRGALWLFRNTGTRNNPVYELETTDYLSLAGELGHNDLQPQWVDFNGDGIQDLGVSSVYDRQLRYHYFPNQSGVGAAVQFSVASRVEVFLPTEVSVSDRIYFVDADNDGDPDLLVGGVLGNISYYENTGSAGAPTWVLRDSALGGMGPSFSRRYLSLAVADFDLDGKQDIVFVDQNGRMTVLYDGDWGKWTKQGTSLVLSREAMGASSPFLGTGLHVTAEDFNGDRKPDVAVGTAGGGVFLFRNVLPVRVTGDSPEEPFKMYPNPAGVVVTLLTGQDSQIEIFNTMGQRMFTGYSKAGIDLLVNVNNWPAGVYLVKAGSGKTYQVKKLVVYPSR